MGWGTSFFFVFLGISSAFAGEPRFERDPQVNLSEIGTSGRIAVRTTKKGDEVTSDASAILRGVSPARLFSISVDFDRYVEMGMPNTKESRVVSRAGDILYTWTHMETKVLFFTQESKHFLEVRVHRSLPNGARGTSWQLLHPSRAYFRPDGSSLADESAFSQLDGSWYLEPQPDGAVYVRYVLSGKVDSGLANSVGSDFVRKQFADGVRQVILTLARQAALRR